MNDARDRFAVHRDADQNGHVIEKALRVIRRAIKWVNPNHDFLVLNVRELGRTDFGEHRFVHLVYDPFVFHRSSFV